MARLGLSTRNTELANNRVGGGDGADAVDSGAAKLLEDRAREQGRGVFG